jgi:DNA-binding LytR/AlgR family response regulator
MKSFISKNRITFRVNKALHMINLDEVLFCEKANQITILHRKDSTTQEIGISFKDLEYKIRNHAYIRTCSSYIINLKFLEKVGGENQNTVTLTGDIKIPIDDGLKSLLLEELTKS